MIRTPRLAPYSNVEVALTGYIATSDEPMLELILPKRIPCGDWIRISYRASYLDHLVRPFIRFEMIDGHEWDVMGAPLFGKASWIGRIPEGTLRVLISPVDRPGPFGFEIENVRKVSRLQLLQRGIRKNPKTAMMTLGARLINARQETRQALMFSRGGISLRNYDRWRKDHFRPFDPFGLDMRRTSVGAAPHIRFILANFEAARLEDAPLLGCLLASTDENWSVCLTGAGRGVMFDDINLARRVVQLGNDRSDVTIGLGPEDLVVRLDASIMLPDYALPVLVEAVARESSAVCFYGDQDVLSRQGKFSHPQLKPDWSPVFEAHANYLGDPVFWRVSKIRNMQQAGAATFGSAQWHRLALSQCDNAQVHHIRRILATLPIPPENSSIPPKPAHPASISVSIIIPTRDQLHLLETCLNGLCFRTDYPVLEILIVDNDSNADVHAYYNRLREDPRIKIISAPGRFNFSAMCNKAAQLASGECLVFLNNDIAVIDPQWLGHLAYNAMSKDVGAVGARLIFPSGAVQHAGVVVGMGGYADHVSHGAPADDEGYLRRMRFPHEVSAVTGACIAVEAKKFHAVGGFDAENLLVELNDIDLCLKLEKAGFTSLMAPDAALLHHQSATRGFSYKPFTRYKQERSFFRNRWRHVIRDDPFFHPALSRFSTDPSLDG